MPKPSAATALFRIAFWFGLCVVITLSLLPVEQLPEQVSLVWDKAQHAAGFAGLALVGLLGYPTRPWWVSIGLVMTGALIEVAQHATGWRHGDVADFTADLIGIAAGAALWQIAKRLRT